MRLATICAKLSATERSTIFATGRTGFARLAHLHAEQFGYDRPVGEAVYAIDDFPDDDLLCVLAHCPPNLGCDGGAERRPLCGHDSDSGNHSAFNVSGS